MRTSRRLLLTSGALSLDSATAAYLAAMPTKPNRPATVAINRFIVGLKANNLWGKIDGGNILALGDTSQAYIDFKVPTRVATPAPGLTSTFTAYRGFTGSGALAASQTDWIDTNFTPSTAGGVMVLDSAQISVWVNTDAANSNRDFGANSANDTLFISRNSGNFVGAQVNDATAVATIANGNAIGFYTLSRTGAAGYDVYKGGTSLGTYATASVGLPAAPLRYLQAQAVGATTRQVSFGCYGSGLNSTEAALLNTLTQSLMGVLLVQ